MDGFLEYKIQPEFNYKCYYFRHVADSFIISNSKKKNGKLFDKLNLAHKAISFTNETDANAVFEV